MTLREKFGEVYIEKGMAKELEKIADEFAIEFAEWVVKGKIDKQLLEIFKKEKGI